MSKGKKIKIAYIIDSINSIAGTEKQLTQMLERLDKQSFETVLICLRGPSGVLKSGEAWAKYIELGLGKLISFEVLFKLIWLIFYLKKEEIEILQTYFADATILGVVAGKFANVRKIICCRRDLGFWHTWKSIKAFKIINKFVTRFQVNSFAVKKYLSEGENIQKEKIDVIENGINIRSFRNVAEKGEVLRSMGLLDGDYIVGIAANLNRRVKRVDVFLKAAAEVARVISNISFVVLGDGYLRKELEGMTKGLGVNDKVVFVGRQDEVEKIIMSWDVGVISSDSEGLSNAIMEYMAAGIGVVATNVGGNKELVKDGVTGILVDAGDYRGMADGICRLLNDKRLLKVMGNEGQRVIKERYDWDVKIKEVEEYYDWIVRGRGRSSGNIGLGFDKGLARRG